MDAKIVSDYEAIRAHGLGGFYESDRGLIAVWGKEAVQFLDGLITNDVKTLADGQQMLAAFPNAQGRLLAVVSVKRDGERLLFETEAATREKLYQNLFRFTFAGDFFVEDLSDQYRYFEFINKTPRSEGEIAFDQRSAPATFLPIVAADSLRADVAATYTRIDEELQEVLRIETGIPKYGVDMDEGTIVPELGLPDLISYTKGCYIGQEIIARIHFRGHVAKQLTGLTFSNADALATGPAEIELTSLDGKPAGKVTSTAFSPTLRRHIALAFVRYEHLAAGTVLRAGDREAVVTHLPFIERDIIEK